MAEERDAPAPNELLALLRGAGQDQQLSAAERYEVLGEVARGGMGVILKVRDRGFRRELAMKVLPDETFQAGSTRVETQRSSRFLDEAQVTGQLEHPGVIPVYEVGLDEDRRLFFTMRLVKGMTLTEVFEHARAGTEGWTLTRALGVLLKVCETMAFAHDKGVVHRDLKPANVMVGRFGETYVMDWGLAKVTGDAQQEERDASMHSVLTTARAEEGARGDTSHATLEGQVMGTPAYMPPEQARGELTKLGPRSDIYSVGAMLYHLLAGSPPYSEDGTQDALTLLTRVKEGLPPSIEELAPSAAPELAAVCRKAMAYDPAERYESMLALADDLHAYLDDRVVAAYRTGALVELKKWVRRNRPLAASLAAAVMIAVAGLGGVSYVQSQARADVEAANALLTDKNVELEEQRARTAEARDLAQSNEQTAVANEREALWQSYVGNVSAALAALEIGSASEARRRLAACAPELRGWEWDYLTQRADGSLATLDDSTTFLYTLDVHPYDPLVAAAGGSYGDTGLRDYVVRLWNFETGELQQELDFHETSVLSLAFSSAGDALVTSDEDGVVAVWDIASGTRFFDEFGLGHVVAFHPDGRQIWSASWETPYRAVLTDITERKTSARLELAGQPTAVAVSPSGQRIAIGDADGQVLLLDGALRVLHTIEVSHAAGRYGAAVSGHGPVGTLALAFSPDGSRLLTSSDDDMLRTWDVETGERLNAFLGHRSPPRAVAWHPTQRWIVSSDETGSLRFWNAETGSPLEVLRGHDGAVSALGFSAAGDRLLSASRDTTVRVWDGQPGAFDTLRDGLQVPNFAPYRLAFSESGDRLAWRRGSEEIVVTDVATGEDLSSFWVPSAANSVIALHLGGDQLLVALVYGKFIWASTTTHEILRSTDADAMLTTVAFDSTSTRAVAGLYVEGASWPWALGLFDLTSGEERWRVPLLTRLSFGALGFTPDGKRIVAGYEGNLMCLEAESGEPVWNVATQGRPFGLAIDPGGSWVAFCRYNQWDNSLYIHDLKSGEHTHTLVGPGQPTLLDAFQDGSRILSGNWDGTISVWSPTRGEVLTLPAHGDIVHEVEVSPGGTTLASFSSDGTLRLWNAAPLEDRMQARRRASGRSLHREEARRRVDDLFATEVHKAAAIRALTEDAALEPHRRDAALLEARVRADTASDLLERIVPIVSTPNQTPTTYLRALEAAETVLVRIPEEGRAFELLAAAQFRMGQFARARETFERGEELRRTTGVEASPGGLFIQAMAVHQLGEPQEARRLQQRATATIASATYMALALSLQAECAEMLANE